GRGNNDIPTCNNVGYVNKTYSIIIAGRLGKVNDSKAAHIQVGLHVVRCRTVTTEGIFNGNFDCIVVVIVRRGNVVPGRDISKSYFCHSVFELGPLGPAEASPSGVGW